MGIARKTNQLYLDGVLMEVNLTLMCKGASFFVPCLNIMEATRQVQEIARQNNLKLTVQTNIYKGMLGIRVWA